MADGVKQRHESFVLGAFYVKRENVSVGAFCTDVAPSGNADVIVSEVFDGDRQIQRGFIAKERRFEWTELWPAPEAGTFRVDVYTTTSLQHPSATVTHMPTGFVESNNDTVSGKRNADLAQARIVERIAAAGACPCCHEAVCDPGCPCETIRSERHSQ